MVDHLDKRQSVEPQTLPASKPEEKRHIVAQALETREMDWAYVVPQTPAPSTKSSCVLPPYILDDSPYVIDEVSYDSLEGHFYVRQGVRLLNMAPPKTNTGKYFRGSIDIIREKGKVAHVRGMRNPRLVAMIEGPDLFVLDGVSPPVPVRISDDEATSLRWAANISARYVALLNETGVFEIQPNRTGNEKAQAWRLEHVGAAVVTPDRGHLAVLLDGDAASAGHIWRIDNAREDAAELTRMGNLPRPSKSAVGMTPDTAAVSVNCKFLAAAGDGKLVVWSLDKGRVVSELAGLPRVKRLCFLDKQYLLADGLLVDMRRQAVVWQYELAEGILPWETFTGNPDSRLWLVFNHPSKPKIPVIAPMEVPEADIRQKLDALTPQSKLPAGSTTITPAMLLLDGP